MPAAREHHLLPPDASAPRKPHYQEPVPLQADPMAARSPPGAPVLRCIAEAPPGVPPAFCLRIGGPTADAIAILPRHNIPHKLDTNSTQSPATVPGVRKSLPLWARRPDPASKPLVAAYSVPDPRGAPGSTG